MTAPDQILDSFNEAYDAYEQWKTQRLKECPELTKTDDDAQALALRHKLTIGGTYAAAIAGYSRYSNALEVFNEMTGRGEEFTGNYITRRGQALEALVGQRAAELLNAIHLFPACTSYDPETDKSLATYISKEDDSFLLEGLRDFGVSSKMDGLADNFQVGPISAQIDGFLAFPDARSGDGFTICECKTASHNPTQEDGQKLWGNGCVLVRDSIIEADDRIPAPYMAQVQWQLLLLSLLNSRNETKIYNDEYAILACDLAGSSDVRIYLIERNEEIQCDLWDAVTSFLKNNLYQDTAPSAVTYAVTKCEELKDGAPSLKCLANDEFLDNYSAYKNLKEQIDELTEEANLQKDLLIAALPDAADCIMRSDGELLLKRTKYKRTSFDAKAMAAEFPEIYKKFRTKTDAVRVTVY